ncbi:hypothetical protein ACVGV8_06410, partial [Enterobacter intestinihominis]
LFVGGSVRCEKDTEVHNALLSANTGICVPEVDNLEHTFKMISTSRHENGAQGPRFLWSS